MVTYGILEKDLFLEMFAYSQARKSLNVAGILLKFHVAGYMKLVEGELACHNSHFSLLLAAGNFLR